MRIRNALLVLGVIAIPALPADYSLELNSETTKIRWTLGDALHTVYGTFNLERGTINFDTDTGRASGEVVVDVASGASGSEARDHRMHAKVLESANYPEAIFTPSRVEGTLPTAGTSNIKVHGTFTIHGAAHEVTMDVRVAANPDQIRATGEFEVPYVAWGMKNPSNFLLKVTKTVRVSIEASGPLQKR